MTNAGHEPALPIGKVETGDHELDQIAEAYLSQAEGDPVVRYSRRSPTGGPSRP
jgi:hypothetical protein